MKQLTPEEANDLSLEEFIDHHMLLVYRESYKLVDPNKDDLISAAVLALCEYYGKPYNIGKVIKTIRYTMLDEIWKNLILKAPESTVRKLKNLGIEVPKFRRIYFNELETELQHELKDDFEIEDFLDNLDLFERKIIELRLMKYTDREIAEKLETNHSRIYTIRIAIGEKYESLEKELN